MWSQDDTFVKVGSIEETLLISLGRLVTIVQSITWAAAGICWPSFSPWPQLLGPKVKAKSRVWHLLPLMLKEVASPSWGQGGLNKQKPLAEEDVTFSHIQKNAASEGWDATSRLWCCPSLCAKRWDSKEGSDNYSFRKTRGGNCPGFLKTGIFQTAFADVSKNKDKLQTCPASPMGRMPLPKGLGSESTEAPSPPCRPRDWAQQGWVAWEHSSCP